MFGAAEASSVPVASSAEVVPPISKTELAAFVHRALTPPPVMLFCIITVALLVTTMLFKIFTEGAIVRFVPLGMVLFVPSVIIPLPVMLPVPLINAPAAFELFKADVPSASVPLTVRFPLTVNVALPFIRNVAPVPMLITPVKVKTVNADDVPEPEIKTLFKIHEEESVKTPLPVAESVSVTVKTLLAALVRLPPFWTATLVTV